MEFALHFCQSNSQKVMKIDIIVDFNYQNLRQKYLMNQVSKSYWMLRTELYLLFSTPKNTQRKWEFPPPSYVLVEAKTFY